MGSTQSDVEVSYGVSNEFFRLWLDEKMNYTCALFKDRTNYSDDFEAAQQNKLRFLSEMAHIGPHTESVLDVGCGWGANIEYQAVINKVPQVHGFTLSAEQHKTCVERTQGMNAVTATCENYLHYQAPVKFDAVMSICMVEHVVSPEDARAGKAIDLYRDWFRRIHSWTKPGSYFGMQCITRCGVPRSKADLDDMRHATYVIFPNAVTPRVEDIIVSSIPYYELVELHSRRFDYRKTTWHWRERLRSHKATIVTKWGNRVFDDYDRYLSTCIKAFENNWQSLHQYSFRRLD